ncbi:hypothetical protein SH668x_003279 [Planctomicrobium sp. SH668]|uniref:hypothetical protein n=1 Tax=Planctomicrobium sp. SH668 TaxID=3448126 RepID=UPI003F5C0647
MTNSSTLLNVNYLAHGIRFLDRPYYLIGSAIPDLLSVSDRRSRVRKKTIENQLPEPASHSRELSLGMLQHLHDDQWFHNTPGFYEVTGSMSVLFRSALGPDEDWHCGFLGHIVTELLIDSTLMEDSPEALVQYYEAFASVDSQFVHHTVSGIATQPIERLGGFIELFVRERFLADYPDNERLLFRLNQVMKRVSLRPLPGEIVAVLRDGRQLVRENMLQLLPKEHFTL